MHKIKRALIWPFFQVIYYLGDLFLDWYMRLDDKYGYIKWVTVDLEKDANPEDWERFQESMEKLRDRNAQRGSGDEQRD